MKNKDEKKIYDLEERTARFGERVIDFAKKIPKTSVAFVLANQFLRSGTSMGANYCEADCAESKKDFEHKLGICAKEAKETMYWLRMLKHAFPKFDDEITDLWKEAHELQLIFLAIIKNSRANRPRSVIGN